MDDLWLAIQGSGIAEAIKFSRWGYATVNAVHILGIALLVGAIVPMNLRLLGAWGRRPLTDLARVLVPVAATGVVIAVTAGVLLFSIKARRYAEIDLLWFKLTLVATGIVSAIVFHVLAGWWLQRSGPVQRRVHAAISLICWIGALFCGRFIAYAGL